VRAAVCNAPLVQILIVEDDLSIADALLAGLSRHGFEAQLVRTGGAALEAARRADLVLLDLGLPDLDGVEVCRRLRAATDIPIIVVSARSDEIDRVMLLEMGADDYVVKPFGLRELVARIRAVSRRRGAVVEAAVTELEGLRVDRRAREVTVDGERVELTAKEFDLLSFLAADPGAALSRRRILEEVWEPNWFGSPKTVDVHIASLRRKLGHPEWIQAVRGVGFRLVVDGSS
jgi:DNA-binding response OmpR family regulator